MKRLKNISKTGLVIAALLLLNLGVFTAVRSSVSELELDTHQMTTQNDDNSYFKSGVDVLNWTYTLYRYFTD